MAEAHDRNLLDVLLDSWDRNNTILTNLVRALPEGGLDAKAMEASPSVAQMLTHIHYVRMVFVSEDAPEFAPDFVEPGPEGEWAVEHDRDRLVHLLNESAKAIRDAVKGRLESGRDMELHYDHPILLLQHMIWHEGYHHGQIKLALKLARTPLANAHAGPLTWRVWTQKTSAAKQ
ncbi:MAG TPA: DinB family protein [Candidatus Acidoferrum sp.]|nr:DinB family protein [Candidatus Acidoferrum sp.]